MHVSAHAAAQPVRFAKQLSEYKDWIYTPHKQSCGSPMIKRHGVMFL
jgi:hypothetical protein